jgi:DNA repair protein RecO (recombination protein O)
MPNADAFVLRTIDFSETSNIVSLYTRQFGKIEGLAKGGRRLKSPFENSLDILTRVRVSFLPKKGDVLDIITESKLIRRFPVRKNNLAGLWGAYYVIELVNLFTPPNDANPALYDLSVRLLNRLERGTSVRRSLLRYESLLLQLLGQQPSFRVCVDCGQQLLLENQKRTAFSVQHGGVVCPHCVQERQETGQGGQLLNIAGETLRGIEQLGDDADRSEQWTRLEIPPPILAEMRSLHNHYLCTILERKPRLFDWFNDIAKNDRE